MLKKIKEVILGGVVGDAIGVPHEFKSRILLDNKPCIDMDGFGTHYQPMGTWSDDSSLTFCLMDGIIFGEDIINQTSENFVKWLYECFWTPHGQVFDVGNATRNSIQSLKYGVSPEYSGGKTQDSNGNGSLMRISPLAFYCLNMELNERYELIKKVSSITHAHIISIKSCFYYIELLIGLINGNNLEESLIIADNNFKLIFGCEFDELKKILNCEISKIERDNIYSSGYVIHTLSSAIWCVSTSQSYEISILKAVNLGNDTDTTAMVTGTISGLVFGYKNIPKKWLNKIVRLNDINELIVKFDEKLKTNG